MKSLWHNKQDQIRSFYKQILVEFKMSNGYTPNIFDSHKHLHSTFCDKISFWIRLLLISKYKLENLQIGQYWPFFLWSKKLNVSKQVYADTIQIYYYWYLTNCCEYLNDFIWQMYNTWWFWFKMVRKWLYQLFPTHKMKWT